jgi:dihydroflavonol-4-reductase
MPEPVVGAIPGPVVVTGASGFIAKYIIAELLQRNVSVRGSLRDTSKSDAVRAAVVSLGADPAKLTFFEADLTKDDGWDEAMKGASYLVHAASPYPLSQPDNPDDLIVPARDGTLRVFLAAHRNMVRRIVLTSSTDAVTHSAKFTPGHIYNETDFTDETNPRLTAYVKSKTLAEKAAWTFSKTKLAAPELVVIAPGFVLGPAVDDDLAASHQLLLSLAKGQVYATPKMTFPVCDVRDVALAHVEALTAPAASGQRFIVAEGRTGVFEIGQKLATELPDLKRHVPRHEISDMSVRLRAITNKEFRANLADLGGQRTCCSQKARDFFGMTFRDADEAIFSAARSLRQLQLI